jgi:hypothetical protein
LPEAVCQRAAPAHFATTFDWRRHRCNMAARATVERPLDRHDQNRQVLTTLNKQGDFKENVLKVNIPRNDVKVTVAGVDTPTPFGFGGWVASTKASDGTWWPFIIT